MTVGDFVGGAWDGSHQPDICIVGSGPAGLSIALQFIGRPTTVLVLEAGHVHHDAAIEQLGEIESVGLRRAPLDTIRRHGLGGTSALWSGRCGVFDSIDLEHRAWVPDSGWPVSHSELMPFVEPAGQLLGLGPPMYDEASSSDLRAPWPWANDELLPVVWQFSRNHGSRNHARRELAAAGVEGAEHLGALQHGGAPEPTHFGTDFRAVLDGAPNVHVALGANVTEIRTDEPGRNVDGVVVRAADGSTHTVRARRVVLACGAIDNARLLLASRHQQAQGLGNRHDVVGRYLMDHPYAAMATYDGEGSRSLRRSLGSRWVGVDEIRHVYTLGLRLHPEVQRRHELLNAALHLVEFGDRLSPVEAAGRAGRAMRGHEPRTTLAADLRNAATHPRGLARGLHDRYGKRRPSLTSPDRVEFGVVVEQVPDRNSRVTLAARRDPAGVPLAHLDWRADDREHATAVALANIVTAQMQRLGVDPMPTPAAWLTAAADVWRAGLHDMAHPLGTTRMADDPRHGVVDRNCQVHGIEGLYVIGGSVFPTSGYMNPTLMIVAMAVRLADHLARRPAPVALAAAGDPL